MKERYLASKQEKGKFYQLSSHTQCGFSVSVKLLCNGILTVCFHHKAFLFDIIVKKKKLSIKELHDMPINIKKAVLFRFLDITENYVSTFLLNLSVLLYNFQALRTSGISEGGALFCQVKFLAGISLSRMSFKPKRRGHRAISVLQLL